MEDKWVEGKQYIFKNIWKKNLEETRPNKRLDSNRCAKGGHRNSDLQTKKGIESEGTSKKMEGEKTEFHARTQMKRTKQNK